MITLGDLFPDVRNANIGEPSYSKMDKTETDTLASGKQISIQNVSRHMKVIHHQTVPQEKPVAVAFKPY